MMLSRNSLHGAMVLTAFLASSALARDYYVDNRRGNDANEGLSSSCPLETLAAATAKLGPGDVLHVAPGAKYRESLRISRGGTAAAPIVVKGGGAVLCGLSAFPKDGWEAKGDGLFFLKCGGCWGALCPRVFLGEERMLSVACVHYDKVDETGLRPLEAVWKTAGVWLRVEPGRAPADYDLRGSFARGAVGDSGVLIQDADYLVIEDLVAEGFPNDGFNVHGSCHGLVFRGITARWNGDDGFSVHEDVQAGVYNAHFHHNDYGIQDVGASQTSFFGCLVETNRLCGVDLYGGMRILYDTIVRGNGGGQVRVRTNLAANLGFARENPMFSAQSYLKRVSIGCGSGEGLLVGANCRACAVDCTISGVDVGVRVDGGELHLVKSEVSDCRRRVLDTAKAKSFMTNSCAIAIGP